MGFYWTLPMPRLGFTALPADPDLAAAASRTIRYQRERVRRWVAEEGGAILHEEAFLEVAPDRGSGHVLPVLDRLAGLCRRDGAQIVLVRFWEAWGWRSHAPLLAWLDAHPSICVTLDPAPLDGEQPFDPVAHFRAWRALDGAFSGDKAVRRAAALAAVADRREASPTLAALAGSLNEDGIPTTTGRLWTAEALRKFLQDG